jgi:hypothetical protein
MIQACYYYLKTFSNAFQDPHIWKIFESREIVSNLAFRCQLISSSIFLKMNCP